MQLCASALRSGGSVVWVGKCLEQGYSPYNFKGFHHLILILVDASSNMVRSRLTDIISGFQSQSDSPSSPISAENPVECMSNFHHFTTPTLAHLLALLIHPSIGFPPPEASLIVIDSIATVFALAFPRSTEHSKSQQTPIKKSDATQWASGRRWAVAGDFISKIGRLAATSNIAVLLTNQTNTRIRSETGAMLHPAVSGTAWDSGIGTRVVLFRDWMFQTNNASSSQGETVPGVRFAGVVKAKSVSYDGVGKLVAFRIEKVRKYSEPSRRRLAEYDRTVYWGSG